MNKGILKKIKSIDWEWEWDRKTSVLINYTAVKAWTRAPKELAGHLNNVLVTNKKRYSNFFVSRKELERCGRLAYRLSIKKGFIDFYERNARKSCRALVKASRPDPEKDIDSRYHEWVDAQIGLFYFVVHIRIFNRIGERKLKEFIKSRIENPEEQAKAFFVLSATTRGTAFDDFHEMMEKAYKEKRKGNDKKVKDIVSRIVRDFKWIPAGYGDEPEWTAKDIEEQLRDFRLVERHRVNKEEFIKKLNPDEEILRLIKVIDMFVYYKDYLKMVCNYCSYYSRPIFTELGKKYNLSFEETKMLTPDEIGKAKPGMSGITFSDSSRIYNIDFTRDMEEMLFSHEQKEITGTAASPGKARGNAVVINNPDDLKKECKGCILVSVMTTPDLIPAINKAKAIVTDEGGITCHAAIISRELKIPCIIGTKTATKVLKDGDLVEVDADKGVVRKIEKKKVI